MSNNLNISKEILHDIESGKYRNYYLIYVRKSTDDIENQKNSIKFQKSETSLHAFREHLQIAQLTIDGFMVNGIISERHSAFKEGTELLFGENNSVQYNIERPKFHRLVKLLSKEYFKGVIFLCLDRASRNKGDEMIIRKLMKAGVDIHFVLAKYDKNSAGELHMDIDGVFTQHSSRNTREKVTMTMHNKRAQGICIHRAPVGYLNQGQMEHKPIDPERAPIVRKLFEMYTSENWSLADLARWATEQGFTMPPMRRRRTQEEIWAEDEDDIRLDIKAVCRPPKYNTIHKMLTNPFYTGKVLNNEGVWIKSISHKPIVSEDLFNRVQTRLRKKNKSVHYAKVLDHPLRGIVRCALCQRVYTPYPKKGIMYYGVRCVENCSNPNKSFNFTFITEKIGELINNLSFTENELEELDARTGTEIALLEAKRLNQLDTNERKKKRLREDLAYLNANRLTLLKTGAFTPEKIVEEDDRLNAELIALQDTERISDVSMRETVKDVVKLSELLKNVYLYYALANPSEKEEIIKEIFSELTINEETLYFECKTGLQPLKSRFVSVGGPKQNRTADSSLQTRRYTTYL